MTAERVGIGSGNERERILATCRHMVESQLVLWSAGNVSVRSGDALVVTPSGVPYADLLPDDMVEVDVASGAVAGARQPTSELGLHLGLMRALPDVGAIVHTHSKHALALAVARQSIPFICNESLGTRAREILVTDFAPPGSTGLADACLGAFRTQPGSRAVLLANHGVVAIGPDLESAYVVAQQVEWVAEVYVMARQLGGVNVLTSEQQDALAANYGVQLPASPPDRTDSS